MYLLFNELKFGMYLVNKYNSIHLIQGCSMDNFPVVDGKFEIGLLCLKDVSIWLK